MKSKIARSILSLLGWKIIGSFPHDIKKAVVIVAPHTSNLDFIIGRLAYIALRMQAKYLIKKELFKFPFGPLIRLLGGIPIDRSKNNNTVPMVVDLFNESPSLYITITPEGTRKYNAHWKKGFYYIALMAKVPIVMAFIDYGKKEGGIKGVFYPTGDFEKDFKEIERHYIGLTARFPEKYNLSK